MPSDQLTFQEQLQQTMQEDQKTNGTFETVKDNTPGEIDIEEKEQS